MPLISPVGRSTVTPMYRAWSGGVRIETDPRPEICAWADRARCRAPSTFPFCNACETSSTLRFLLVRAVTGVVVAIATWGALVLLDTPQAAVWAILAGVFNSIPYFGPVIVSGGLFVVGIVQSGDLTQALEMSGAALVITSSGCAPSAASWRRRTPGDS